MKKILVIPLWLGDMFDKTTHEEIRRVCQYLLRSLVFFGTKEDFLIMYPKTEKNICELYVSHFKTDNILPSETKTLVMDMYLEPEKNDISLRTSSADPIRNQLIDQLDKVKKSEEFREENIIVFINTVHVPLFISAVKNTFGVADKMKFDSLGAGGAGNTEAFFFDREDRCEGAENLVSLSYLDFFIPKDLKSFTPEIMRLGKCVHLTIKTQGHARFLSNWAQTMQ